jgi:hypothetical protein
LIVVAFFFPLAIYCLVLGLVNRRRHPLMVSGAWDCAGLVFAVSGFLAFGLPGLLSGFTEYGRETALVGPHTTGHSGILGWLWECYEGLCAILYIAGAPAVLIGYFLVVVAASALLMWRRQSQTVIYNIHTDVFDDVLAGVLKASRLAWSRAGPRYLITRRSNVPPGESEPGACLEVDAAAMLRHVTLHWEAGDVGVRKQVEAELLPALAMVRTRDNPMGAWLLCAGTSLLSASVMMLAFAVLYRIYGR